MSEADPVSVRRVTAAEVSANAVSRWRRQYAGYANDYRLFDGRSVGEIDAAMVAAQGDPEKIAAVHGNKGWSHPQCSCCGERADEVALIERRSYDEETQICPDCLARAAVALRPPPATSGDQPRNGLTFASLEAVGAEILAGAIAVEVGDILRIGEGYDVKRYMCTAVVVRRDGVRLAVSDHWAMWNRKADEVA